MNRLLTILTIMGCVMLFLLSPPMLELIGWPYLDSGASIILKIHPAFYLFIISAFLIFTYRNGLIRPIIKSSWFLLYSFAAICLLAKGIYIGLGGVTGGELSVAIVSFIIPVLVLMCVPMLNSEAMDKAGTSLHAFFAINAVLAISEQIIGHRFIPSFLDFFPREHRSAALWGHPLTGALFTGLFIVHLVSMNRKNSSNAVLFGEIILQVVALFAYGGRSALVFTAVTILLSGLLASNNFNKRNYIVRQRILPFLMVIIGIIIVFIPIPMIDATIDRFTNDGGSAESRNSALAMLNLITHEDFLYGITGPHKIMLEKFLHTEAGIELCWISLILSYGLIVVIPLAIGLPAMLIGLSARLDRSVAYMSFMFFVVSAGSQGFSSKSTAISQFLVMVLVLGRRQRLHTVVAARPVRSEAIMMQSQG